MESGGHALYFLQFVKTDFSISSLSAMKSLFTNGKHNWIYDFSKCFEGPIPRMPINQMPYGLLDYNICFFAKEALKTLALKNIMYHGLRQCFHILGTSGYASTGDQLGSMKLNLRIPWQV